MERPQHQAAESIYSYVDKESIADTLCNTDLTIEELDVAVNAVQQNRAQWVVDSIAEELGGRVLNLSDRLAELRGEIDVVESELDAINSLFSPKPTAEASTDLIEKRRKLFEANTGNWQAFLAEMRSEPPFTLYIETSMHHEDSYTLTHWSDSHATLAKERYGRQACNITRAAGGLTRILRFNHLSEMQERGVIEDVVTFEQGIGIKVDDPYKFFDYVADKTGYGTGSAIATLCIADMQREEGMEQKLSSAAK